MAECLRKWVVSYYTEARRAIPGIEKYKLAPEYEHLYVKLVQWVQWSDGRRNQHFNAFMRVRPKHLRTKKANLEVKKKTNVLLGYHNHSYFEKYLKINKLD